MTDDDETATAPEEATPPVPPSEQGDGEDGESDDERGGRSGDHQFSGGQGFDDPYGEAFDLEPSELKIDPGEVDPVDSHALSDQLDERQIGAEQVDAEELLDVGLSYMQIKRHEQAADAFERAARFTDEERLEQEAWVNKGVAHGELEEWDPAIGAYREALQLDTDSSHTASAHTNLAYALYESGQGEQALEHAERAVEADSRFPQGWYNRGFFLLERGLAEDAVNSFDNALRLGFRNAEILEEKARALDELGQYDRAEEVASEAEEMRERAEQELVDDHAGPAGGAGGGGGPAGAVEGGEVPRGQEAPGRQGASGRGEGGPAGGLAEELAEEFAGDPPVEDSDDERERLDE